MSTIARITSKGSVNFVLFARPYERERSDAMVNPMMEIAAIYERWLDPDGPTDRDGGLRPRLWTRYDRRLLAGMRISRKKCS